MESKPKEGTLKPGGGPRTVEERPSPSPEDLGRARIDGAAVICWGSKQVDHYRPLAAELQKTSMWRIHSAECQKLSIYCFPPATGTTGTGSYRD